MSPFCSIFPLRFLLTFYLDNLSIDVSGVLKFPEIIALLSIYPLRPIIIVLYISVICFWCININNSYVFLMSCPFCH